MTNSTLATLVATLALLGACTSGGDENGAIDSGVPITVIAPAGPDDPAVPGDSSGSGDPNPSGEPTGPVESGGSSTVGFDGTWQEECESGPGTSDRESTVIDGNGLAILSTTYRGADCAAAAVEIRVEGRIAFGGRTVVSTGETAENVDITLEAVTVRYLDAPAVESANEAAVCGRADWRLGVSYDISDCEGAEAELPTTFYDLIYRVDDVFYTGDDSGDGATPATRPTGIDFTSPSRRVPG